MEIIMTDVFFETFLLFLNDKRVLQCHQSSFLILIQFSRLIEFQQVKYRLLKYNIFMTHLSHLKQGENDTQNNFFKYLIFFYKMRICFLNGLKFVAMNMTGRAYKKIMTAFTKCTKYSLMKICVSLSL